MVDSRQEGSVFGEEAVERHHFAYFVGCCKALIHQFGISDWDVAYHFFESDEDTPRASMVVHCRFNRVASIQLYDSWDKVPSEHHLWRTAFHEVMELLLADLGMMAQSRTFDPLAYDRESHRVIRIMESAWFEEAWHDGNEVFNFQPSTKGRGVSRPEIPVLGSEVPVPDPGLRSKKRSTK
jgi:hypothetical protein